MNAKRYAHGGLLLALLGFRANAQSPNLLENGGFETGDLTGWTTSGNLSQPQYTFVSTSAAHSGNYALWMAPDPPQEFISQTLPTVPGVSYDISVWVVQNIPGAWGEVSVLWGGNPIYDQNNPSFPSYTDLSFRVTASSASTVFSVGSDKYGYYIFDDLSVTAVPEPREACLVAGFLSLGAGLLCRRLKAS